MAMTVGAAPGIALPPPSESVTAQVESTRFSQKFALRYETGIFLLFRSSLSGADVVQADVGVGEDVVSFATLFLEKRAFCRFVYLADDKWFGVCDVFSVHFESLSEIVEIALEYAGTEVLSQDTFFLSSSGGECGPLLIKRAGKGFGPSQGERSPVFLLGVAREIGTWSVPERELLRNALDLAGGRGANNLNWAVAGLLGKGTGESAVTREEFIEGVDIPEEILDLLGEGQAEGLEEFFDDVVRNLP